MYKLFLTIRYLRKRRIAYFAVAAVTLCVAMVLVVMSVMGGWLDQVKNRARGLLGDVVIDNGAQAGFPLYQEFIDEIAAWPEIEKATPVVYTVGLVGFTNTARSAYVEVVGIRLGEVCQVNAFKGGLFYEKWYPGTTKLDEAGWPKMGIDLKDPSWSAAGGSYINLVPPPPFDKLWKQAAAQYRAASGGQPLVDADSVDDPYNDVLRENGRDVIPGRWEVNEDAEGEQDLGHPAVLAPGWTDEDRKLPGVILGRDIVARRETDGRYRRLYPKGLPVRLTVVPVTIRGKVDPKPVSKGFRYVDDSRTGIYEIDSRHVYVDFDVLQALMDFGTLTRVDDQGNEVGKAPARCSQIQVKLKPGIDPYAAAKRLTERYRAMAMDPRYGLDADEQQLLGWVEAQPWQETQAHIIAPIEKEKMLVTILFGIISMVAVALILCILYMIVLQKTRDIGILKAIGGSSGGVAAIWVGYGLAVGVVGAILGTVMGTVFVWNINRVQDFLIWAFDFRVWDMRVYSFDTIPQTVRSVDAAAIALIAVAAATLGALGAARRAGLMEPVESIRHE